jgi:hypothetical protein
MPDPNNPIALLMGALVFVGPTIALLFKMLIAEKDERIRYLEDENRDLREIAKQGTNNTQQAITVARQRSAG